MKNKAIKFEESLMGRKIVSAGVGFDGIEFGWIVLDDGTKIFIEKVEVEKVVEEYDKVI